jgi:hypothetical protein
VRGAGVAKSEGDIRTRVSKRESNGAAQTTRGAGYQCDLPSEAETWKFIHSNTPSTCGMRLSRKCKKLHEKKRC